MEEPNTQIADIGYCKVLSNRRGIFGFCSLVLSLTLWTFIDTTLADKLQGDFGINSEIVSLIYAIQMAGFLVTSLLVHRAMTSYNPTLVIAIAFLIQTVATVLTGPSYLLQSFLPNTLPVIISGLLLMGLADSFTSIGAYTEMHDPFVSVNPGCDRDKLSDILSGLYNAGFSLGTFIGPMVGSYLTIWYQSFRICSDYFAIATLIFSVLLIVFVYMPLRNR